MPVPIEVLQTVPVISTAFAVGVAGLSPPSQVILVACMAVTSVTIAHMLRRTELAAERAIQALRMQRGEPEVVQPDAHSPPGSSAMMRAAARWGADVLSSIAGGASGEHAVAAALPRINGNHRNYAASEAGSEASAQELSGFGDGGNDWVMHAARSVGTTPIVSDGLHGVRAQEVRNAARMASVPEGRPSEGLAFGQMVRVAAGRPASSPPGSRPIVGY